MAVPTRTGSFSSKVLHGYQYPHLIGLGVLSKQPNERQEDLSLLPKACLKKLVNLVLFCPIRLSV